MKYLLRLTGLLLAAALLQLTGCARRPTWTGFHGPAYLPAPTGHHPPPVRQLTPAESRRLDSLATY